MKVLRFTAEWCQPCKTLSVVLEDLSKEGIFVEKNLEVYDIEADEEITQKYRIRSVPTLILVEDDGKEIDRMVGLKSIEEIREFLE